MKAMSQRGKTLLDTYMQRYPIVFAVLKLCNCNSNSIYSKADITKQLDRIEVDKQK